MISDQDHTQTTNKTGSGPADSPAAMPSPPHEPSTRIPNDVTSQEEQTDGWSYIERKPSETITVNVKGAASGETILESQDISRVDMLKEVKRILAIIKGGGQNDQGRNGTEGGYQITILHKGQEVKGSSCVQEDEVDLAAIFQTKFQIGDYFSGFESERPVGDDEIPEGTYWALGRQQGEYQLKEWDPRRGTVLHV